MSVENLLLNQALLSLGSNIDPEINLPAAVGLLACYGWVRRVSAVWESPPFGFTDQPHFLNAAVWLETHLSAHVLKKEAIAAIEAELGRQRGKNRNAARTMDIDIMLFNSDIITVGGRRIPDQEVLERPYVAVPLAEIAPEFRHPETGEMLQEIASRFNIKRCGMHRRNDVTLRPGEPSTACPAQSAFSSLHPPPTPREGTAQGDSDLSLQ